MRKDSLYYLSTKNLCNFYLNFQKIHKMRQGKPQSGLEFVHYDLELTWPESNPIFCKLWIQHWQESTVSHPFYILLGFNLPTHTSFLGPSLVDNRPVASNISFSTSSSPYPILDPPLEYIPTCSLEYFLFYILLSPPHPSLDPPLENIPTCRLEYFLFYILLGFICLGPVVLPASVIQVRYLGVASRG